MTSRRTALTGVLGWFAAAVLLGFALLLGFARCAGPDDAPAPARTEPTAAPTLEPVAPGTFTLAVLPDSQYATEAEVPAGETALATQTAWLADHADTLDLQFVLHEGDLVDDACDPAQWERASFALTTLDDAGIPYAVSAGNHDVRYYSAGPDACTDGDPVDHPDEFTTHVPLTTAQAMTTFGGSFSGTDTLSTFHTFEAGGEQFLVLALQFGPTAPEADWALQVAHDHADHHAILLTHDLIGPDGELRGGASTSTSALPKPPRLTGAQLWDRLVAPAPNVVLTLSGHVTEGTAGRSVAPDDAGRPVHRLLANFQTLDGGRTGYLRLLTVDPAAGTIDVRTYSPVLDAWLTDDAHQFTLTDLW